MLRYSVLILRHAARRCMVAPTQTAKSNGACGLAALKREIAGRQIALIALAVYVDQQAVAASNRSWHDVTCSGPWAIEVNGLLDELVTEKLPEAATQLLTTMLEERKMQREQKLAEHQARTEALARLEGIEERIAELGAEDLDQVEEDLDAAWGGWTPRQSELRGLVRARRTALTPEEGNQSTAELIEDEGDVDLEGESDAESIAEGS